MKSAGVSWSDVGNWIEHSGNGALNEDEAKEIFDAGIEEGVRQTEQKFRNQTPGNSHFTLPSTAEMADFCQARRGQLRDNNQREFVDEMVATTRFGNRRLKPGTLGYLASLYIKLGGSV